MPAHVFVDESKARGLLLAAAACVAGDVNTYRPIMAALAMPRQRRIHFTKESAARQRKILGVIADFELSVRLYQAARPDAACREACLSAIVRDASGSAERLVIERDESTLDFDRQTLYAAVRRHQCMETLQYALMAPHLDPMLWIPDAIAGAWAKGGEWRQLVAPFCTMTTL
jgi:hypothetical protein